MKRITEMLVPVIIPFFRPELVKFGIPRSNSKPKGSIVDPDAVYDLTRYMVSDQLEGH